LLNTTRCDEKKKGSGIPHVHPQASNKTPFVPQGFAFCCLPSALAALLCFFLSCFLPDPLAAHPAEKAGRAASTAQQKSLPEKTTPSYLT